MPIQKLETTNVLKQWMDTINTIIDDSSELESRLNEKVDKETGKGLSTNDFTNTLKDKLDGIEEGANNYTLPTANNATKGGVTLSDSTSSEFGTDNGIAATPKAVKIAYDLASNALPKAGGTIEGDLTVTGKINATIEGNTDTANQLSVARTIALTGDVSGSTTFDGSKDVSITVIVADDSHNHTVANIDNLETLLASKAGTTSPTFIGTPKAPTATAGTNTTQIATTAFVQSAIDSKIATADAMIFKGTIGTNGTVTDLPAEHSIGWTYKVATVGIYAGVNCEVGDMIVCLADGITANDADWTVIQTNIDGAVTGPASAVEERIAVFSGTTGKIIKDSGFTIATSVPADAKFTDTTYSAENGITLTGTTFSNSGVRSVSSGTANGTISVNTNGTSADVAVKGLGSAAFTETTAYTEVAHKSVVASKDTNGHVKLSDDTNSDSGVAHGVAATPAAVKSAYDLANAALPKTGGTITGDLTVTGKINASIEGVAQSAISAEKLSNARTVALTGDVTGSATFDGSEDISISVTVADDSHSHTIENIDNLETLLASKAGITSPTFAGIPKAPTASTETNSTQIATTAFVQSVVDSKIAASDAMIFKGTIGTSGTITALPAQHTTGWTYKVITAGTYADQNCEVGDMIVCITDGTTANNAHWSVIQSNIDGAVTGPASSVDAHIAVFNGATGKFIKDSGFTIGTSVPANAVFTDTTYSTGSSSTAGITKLYSSTGTSTDGTMTQSAITTVLEEKLGKEENAVSASKLEKAKTISLSGAIDSSVEFDGSSDIELSVDGVKEAYLEFGGKHISGGYSPVDAALIPYLGANRFAFGNANAISVEYSRDGGSTWIDYGASDMKKRALFSSMKSGGVFIGKSSSDNKANVNCLVRISITDTTVFPVYADLNKLEMCVDTEYSNGCYVTIDGIKANNPNEYTVILDRHPISGNPGSNIINTNISTYGSQYHTDSYKSLRFTFGCTEVDSKITYGLTVYNIFGYGYIWSVANVSNMAQLGHIYSYDGNQNVTFPSHVIAPVFEGSATKAIKDGSGNIIIDTYATKNELSSLEDNLSTVAVSGSYNDLTDKPTSLKNPTSLTIQNSAGTSIGTYDGSSATTVKLDKSTVGLGNVTNESKATMFTSAALTGTPTAPTATAGTNTTQIATTAFVQSVVDSKIAAADAMIYKGTIGTGGTVTALPNTHSTGWTYKVITAGTYAGVKCNVGDMIICLTDGTAANNAHWTVVEGNIDGAVTGPVSSVASNVAIFDGATGKVIKDSGFSIASNVPSGAKFTDTTYTVGTTSYSGTTKLYTSTGSNTDGTITQKVITDTFLTKQAFDDYKNSEDVAEARETSWTNPSAIAQNSIVTIPNGVLYPYGKNAIIVSVDGVVLSNGINYEEVGSAGDFSNQIKFLFEIEANSIIKVWVSAQALVYGSWDFIQDSVDTTFENVELCRQYTANVDMSRKADIASPTFTGTPAAPTAAVGTNTTQIATTAFVNSTINNLLSKGIFSNVIALTGTQIDVSLGSCFTKNITAATTFTITGCEAGKSGIFTLVLTNGGSKTVTWDSSIKWADDEVPELTASGVDVLTFITVDGGTTWYGTPSIINAL